MGQYWKPVNLTKKEFLDPHKLGSGIKLWEMLAASPGVGTALIILCAAMPEKRGGGDLDLDENWHGPERKFPEHNCSPGPMPDAYQAIAQRTIGRWAGDRITLIGDYAEDGDVKSQVPASHIYERCVCDTDSEERQESGVSKSRLWKDVTDDVCAVIEHELQGKFSGTGWRDWAYAKSATA